MSCFCLVQKIDVSYTNLLLVWNLTSMYLDRMRSISSFFLFNKHKPCMVVRLYLVDIQAMHKPGKNLLNVFCDEVVEIS